MTVTTKENIKLESVTELTLFYKNIERRKRLVALRKYIKNKFTYLNDELVRLADAAGEIKGEKTEELFSLLRHELLQLGILHNEISQPFSIFIMGLGKHGKSTLINALTGTIKAEIDFLPKTWKIDIFQYLSNIDKACICFDDGSSQWMPEEEAVNFLKEEEARRDKSERIVTEELIKQQSSIKYDKEALDKLKTELQNKYLYKSPVVNVLWPCSRNRILSHFKLVDTPGVKQELLSKDITERVEDYYNKADGALWILDATVLTKEGSMHALESLNINELNNDNKNVILVLNKIDKIRDVKEYSDGLILAEANKIYGAKVNNIVLLSAKEALEGVLLKNEQLVEQSGYNVLIDRIEKTFLNDAGTIKFYRKLKGFEGYISNIITVISEYLAGIEKDINLYEKLKSRFEDDLEHRSNALLNRVNSVIKEYEEGVKSRIYSKVDKIFEFNDGDEVVRTKKINEFIISSIFIENELNSMMSKIQRSIIDELENLGHYWQEKSVFKKYEFIKEKYSLSKAFIDSVDVPHTSISIDVDVGASIGLGALGGGLAASLLGGPVGWVVGVAIFLFTLGHQHDQRRQKATSKLCESLSNLLNNISKKTEIKIRQQAQNIKYSVNQIRERSFNSLYCSVGKARQIKDVLSEVLVELKLEYEMPRTTLSDFFEGGTHESQE